jgi:hypothetical protein
MGGYYGLCIGYYNYLYIKEKIMATKIFDAYYIPDGIAGAVTVRKIIDQEYTKWVLAELTRCQDKIGKDLIYQTSHLLEFERSYLEYKSSETAPSVWGRALRDMDELAIECIVKANSRHLTKGVLFDFDCSMVLFYYKSNYYAQFFNFGYWSKPIFKSLQDNTYLVDWHYQDQGDKPEGISNFEWKERESLWESLFASYGSAVPSHCGFSVDFVERISSIIRTWKKGLEC